MYNYVEDKKMEEYNKKVRSKLIRRDSDEIRSKRFKKIVW